LKILGLILCLLFLCFASEICKAQKLDSLKSKRESIVVVHSPRKASILSTILPGAGQVYNKKYWKVPIVYAGLGAFGYLFVINRGEYNAASREIIVRNDTSKKVADWTISSQYPESYSASDILVSANQYRRNSELSAVGILVFYTFQIVDAYVDAHLFTFDVSDDLSLKIEPTIIPFNRSAGLSLRLGFR